MFTMDRQICSPEIAHSRGLRLEGSAAEVINNVSEVSLAALVRWKQSLPADGTSVDITPNRNYNHGHFYFSGLCASVSAVAVSGVGGADITAAPNQNMLERVAEIEGRLAVLNRDTGRSLLNYRRDPPFSVKLDVQFNQLCLTLNFANDSILHLQFTPILESLSRQGLRKGAKDISYPETYSSLGRVESFHPRSQDVLTTKGTSFSNVDTGAQVSSAKSLYVNADQAQKMIVALDTVLGRNIKTDPKGLFDTVRLPTVES